MRAFVAVVQREIAERRLVGAAGLLLGLVPLLLPFLPGTALSPTDLRGGGALLLAALFAGGLALILGATVVGRDLAERRLSFYFARPVPGWAVWAGKIAAALVLTLGGGALVLLPAGLLGDVTTVGSWGMITAGAAATLLLVPLSHAVAFLARSRTLWLLLDVVALLGLSALLWVVYRMLAVAGAFRALDLLVPVLAGMAALALLAAGAVQVARGRTDTGRGHRLLSLTLWGSLLAVTLGLSGVASWVLHPAPSDLASISGAAQGSSDRWVTVVGETANRGGYSPAFLFDVQAGGFRRIALPSSWNGPIFSRDGQQVVWREISWTLGRAPEVGVTVARIDGSGLHDERQLPLPNVERGPDALALSPAGDCIAVLSRGRVLVATLPEGRLLASVPDTGYQVRLRFLDQGRIRIVQQTGVLPTHEELTVRDLEIATQTLTERVRILPALGAGAPDGTLTAGAPVGQFLHWNVSPDGTRLEIIAQGARRLVDAETGRELARLPELGWSRFLADGRWMTTSSSPAGTLAQLFRRDGTLERTFQLPAGALLRGQPTPGLLALQLLTRRSSRSEGPEVLLLDLATGQLRSLGTGLWAAADSGEGLASRLFVRGERELLLLDPATRSLKPVLTAKG